MAQPHWAMCMVCGEVLYAGPGINPIPRECGCKATRVLPREERGYVQWDKKAYAAAAEKQANDTRERIIREAKIAEATKLKSLGFSAEDIQAQLADVVEKATAEAEAAAKFELENFPKEPEVEYTEDELDPGATRRPVTSRTLSAALKGHYDRINAGEDING